MRHARAATLLTAAVLTIPLGTAPVHAAAGTTIRTLSLNEITTQPVGRVGKTATITGTVTTDPSGTVVARKDIPGHTLWNRTLGDTCTLMVSILQEGGQRRGGGETTIPCGQRNVPWTVTTTRLNDITTLRCGVLTDVSVRVRQSLVRGGTFTVAKATASLMAACGW
ncbi:hypothetical protein ABZ897_33650 [Nonomuraea sp. NPDC046802]|uniref:hypothetical protein n=1 Tax=Nonomuraea sp. NPDC046802 TaxID=3154919 RepID=UPI0033FF14EC